MSGDAAEEVAQLLVQRRETLAVAETTAGGLISARLAAIPGASAWFLGGAVAYGAAAKQRWLDVTPQSLGADGAVSVVAAHQLAEAARRTLQATWGLAETGIAGPQTGRRSRKPAGLVYLAVAGPEPSERELLTGLPIRTENQAAFANAALELLLQSLQRAPRTPLAPAPDSTPSPQ